MITLNLNNFKSVVQLEVDDDPIKCAIKNYYNYCDCNDFKKLKCPCCGNHSLSFHKTYERNLVYYYNRKMNSIIVNIRVLKCSECSKIKGNQKYHALLPDFVLPYIIYEASTIMKALSDYFNKIKLNQILERLKIRHKLFYDWLKKLYAYSFSASIILKINNIIDKVISSIIEKKSLFLNDFYHNYNHPFFLFRLTCVPLCIIP